MRSIVHLDADAFFAAVEQAADPRLRGKPVAVGGEKRGVIASASYEARRLGIYTPMPVSRARKLCPKLILLPGDFEKYERFSQWMFSYAYDFTPDVEITSIDEGYFDLSGAAKPAVEVADILRRTIRQSLKISVSEGIASNKLVSQVASKLQKPAGFLQVPSGGEKPFLHPLPNRWLPGVGPKTGARLDAAGLARIEHVAGTPLEMLGLLVGNTALELKRFANGVDERPVVPACLPAKSYSHQETFPADQTDESFVEATLRHMADRLMVRVREERKSIRTLTVKVRYNDMAEDQCGESLLEPTDLETDLYGRLHLLLRQAWRRRVSLRLVSLKLSNVYEGAGCGELELPSGGDRSVVAITPAERQRQRGHEADRRLACALDILRQTHGQTAVMRGHDLRLREGPPASESASVSATAASAEATAAPGSKPNPVSNPNPISISVSISISTRKPVTNMGGGGSGIGRPMQALGTLALAGTPHVLASPANTRTAPGRTAPAKVAVASTRTIAPVPLAAHSYYSFLDSTLSPSALVSLAARYEMPALALTDDMNLHGAVEFSQAARAAGIQPILGATVTHQKRTVRLYVENAAGYRNLCRLLSRVPMSRGEDGERKQPGTIASADPSSWNTEGLIAVAGDTWWERYFQDRFYVGITHAEMLDRTPDAHRYPVIAIAPIHHAGEDDRWKYRMAQSIRTRTLLNQEHPEKRLDANDPFLPPSAWRERFGSHPRLLEHARELADRCRFEIPFGKPQFPAFHPPDGSTAREFLAQLVLQGLRRRYPASHRSLEHQVAEELGIIAEVGYEEYFLVVWQILHDCRREGIEWITRGSAADSLVCYCLGISDVCPIRFKLYFRRFLNRERMALNKLPDIDVDFPHDRKDDVVDLIFKRFGREHTAVVGGFSTFHARAAVGDVAKVLGVSEYQIRRFTEHFPWTGARGLEQLLRQSPECRDLPLDEEPYRSALQMAEFLEGFPRYPKMHPCGVVLSREPMECLTPCFESQKGYPTTHFDMDAVEAIGLVKMDILAQGGLAAMRDTSGLLRERGIEIDLRRFTSTPIPILTPIPAQAQAPAPTLPLPLAMRETAPAYPPQAAVGESPQAAALSLAGENASKESDPWVDPEVWEMIASGGARAVHHIESPAMISLCRQCNVREINGLVAIVSVIRPGAANEQKKTRFTRRYQKLEPVTYPHPSLESCLEDTFGLVVYEEHILQICEAFAGLPPGRADVLRRALGKEKQDVIETIAAEFEASARARGHSTEAIGEVWNLVRGFAGYAFCKAHSTAYGVEAYQAAWLKRYYPAEFMASVLTNGKGFYRPLVYVLECHRLGLSLLPPSVLAPGPGFRVEPTGTGSPGARAIRVPVSAILGIGDRTKERILAEHAREPAPASLADFYCRIHPSLEEMELLSRCGALDGFGLGRTAQFWEIQHLHQRWGKADDSGQGWLFATDTKELPGLSTATRVEPERAQRLRWEMELLGFTASGHPLELYSDIAWETYCPVSRLGRYIGEEVTLCGLIIEDRIHHQVTGEPMKFLTLADWTGMVETELFAETYKSYALATVRYPVLEVVARVEPYENGRGHTLRVLRAGKPRARVGLATSNAYANNSGAARA